jgi:hypothetical protein
MLELITGRTAVETEVAVRGTLDELAREGARRMIEVALQVEVEEYVSRHRRERDAAGHAVVVRNGTARPRTVTTGVIGILPSTVKPCVCQWWPTSLVAQCLILRMDTRSPSHVAVGGRGP